MSLLKEFEIKADEVSEGLMWGGITLPQVIQQKDGSCFSVIEYEPYEKNYLTKNLNLPEFRRGWAIWNERQHTLKGDKNFFVIFWNPFETKENPYIENTLGSKVKKKEFLKYFSEEVERILQEFSKVAQLKLLEYQELMDFLSFELTQEETKIGMPEVPLYMDALLSQDVNFNFKANDIYINGKRILAVTLPELLNDRELFEGLKNFSFRYVRRMLTFDEKESETELKKYTSKWCSGRKIMLEEIARGILSKFNGYCWNGFILQLEDSEYKTTRAYFEKYLQSKQTLFIFEEYNLKDVWWGSLAGMYLANITPPIVGFNSVEEFILNEESVQAEKQENKFKKILEEMERTKNVPNGQI